MTDQYEPPTDRPLTEDDIPEGEYGIYSGDELVGFTLANQPEPGEDESED